MGVEKFNACPGSWRDGVGAWNQVFRLNLPSDLFMAIVTCQLKDRESKVLGFHVLGFLKQQLPKYGPWAKSGSLPAFLNKVFLRHSHAHLCTVVYGPPPPRVEWMQQRLDGLHTWNIYCVALCRKCLPASVLEQVANTRKDKYCFSALLV